MGRKLMRAPGMTTLQQKIVNKFQQTTVVFIIASQTVAEVIAFFLIINTTTPGTFEFTNTTGYSCKYS